MPCLDVNGVELKIGDIVTCVDRGSNRRIEVGETYEIKYPYSDNYVDIYIYLDNGIRISRGFYSFRFSVVTSPKEKKTIPKEKYDKLPNYMKECYDVMS